MNYLLLAMQGVNKQARDLTEETVMHQAASQARLNVLKTLLSFNDSAVVELLSCQNSVGDTPLHCAASIGSASCVRTLLDSSGIGLQPALHSGPRFLCASGSLVMSDHLVFMKHQTFKRCTVKPLWAAFRDAQFLPAAARSASAHSKGHQGIWS